MDYCKNLSRALLCAIFALQGLTGCSSLLSSVLPSAVSRVAKDALEGPAERVLIVNLLGGLTMNANVQGQPRSLVTCIYLTLDPSWRPGGRTDDTHCQPAEPGKGLLVSQRGILAPNRLLQWRTTIKNQNDVWLVVDASYEIPSENYEAQRIKLPEMSLSDYVFQLDRGLILNLKDEPDARERPSRGATAIKDIKSDKAKKSAAKLLNEMPAVISNIKGVAAGVKP
jgi:predicted component of type VI protein secretion system